MTPGGKSACFSDGSSCLFFPFLFLHGLIAFAFGLPVCNNDSVIHAETAFFEPVFAILTSLANVRVLNQPYRP